MASLHYGDVMYVDYSLNGHVREFELNGQVLFNEKDGVADPQWEKKLWDTVHEYYLDEDTDGIGLHAFVYPLIQKYGAQA